MKTLGLHENSKTHNNTIDIAVEDNSKVITPTSATFWYY